MNESSQSWLSCAVVPAQTDYSFYFLLHRYKRFNKVAKNEEIKWPVFFIFKLEQTANWVNESCALFWIIDQQICFESKNELNHLLKVYWSNYSLTV